MKPSVYVETTIPSYLTAWPSRDLIREAHQQVTREWWGRREAFELFTSQIVIEECERGDSTAAAARLAALDGIVLLELVPHAAVLARAIMRRAALPVRAGIDALHIAIAAVHGMDILLTWNCTHIANATLYRRIAAVCEESGHKPPLICTPLNLIGEEETP